MTQKSVILTKRLVWAYRHLVLN